MSDHKKALHDFNSGLCSLEQGIEVLKSMSNSQESEDSDLILQLLAQRVQDLKQNWMILRTFLSNM